MMESLLGIRRAGADVIITYFAREAREAASIGVTMKYRDVPRAPTIRVSEVGFGTWTISTGWWGEKTDDEAVGMLRSRARRSRHHLLRRRRRVRQRPRRAAARRGVPRATRAKS